MASLNVLSLNTLNLPQGLFSRLAQGNRDAFGPPTSGTSSSNRQNIQPSHTFTETRSILCRVVTTHRIEGTCDASVVWRTDGRQVKTTRARGDVVSYTLNEKINTKDCSWKGLNPLGSQAFSHKLTLRERPVWGRRRSLKGLRQMRCEQQLLVCLSERGQAYYAARQQKTSNARNVPPKGDFSIRVGLPKGGGCGNVGVRPHLVGLKLKEETF